MKITICNGWKKIPYHSFLLEIIDLQIEIAKECCYLYFTLLNFDIIIELYNTIKEE